MSKKKPHSTDDGANTLVGRDAHIAKLKAGEAVVFGEKGNSMVPKLQSGQKCVYVPVKSPADLHKGDIVFAKVGPFHYTHLISAISEQNGATMYQISNNSGRVNGWTSYDHIYAKVAEALPSTVTKKQITEILAKYNKPDEAIK